MKDMIILYCFTLVITSLNSMQVLENKNVVDSIRQFSSNHFAPGIVIPLINLIYKVCSNVFFYVLEGDTTFGNLTDIIFSNLTDKEYTYFNIVLYSIEIAYYYIMVTLYYVFIIGVLNSLSNIRSGGRTSLMPALVFIFLILKTFILKRVQKSYKKHQRELVTMMFDIVKGIIVLFSMTYLINKFVEYYGNGKTEQILAKYKTMYENNIKQSLLKEEFSSYIKSLYPLKEQAILTCLLQGVSYTFFASVKNNGTYDKSNIMTKQRILMNIFLLINTFTNYM